MVLVLLMHALDGLLEARVLFEDGFDRFFQGANIVAARVVPDGEEGDVADAELVARSVLPAHSGLALGSHTDEGLNAVEDFLSGCFAGVVSREEESTDGVDTIGPHIHAGVSGPGAFGILGVPSGRDREEAGESHGFAHSAAIDANNGEATGRVQVLVLLEGGPVSCVNVFVLKLDLRSYTHLSREISSGVAGVEVLNVNASKVCHSYLMFLILFID